MFFVCISLFAILSVGKMYRFSSFAHWLCIVYKYKKLWSAIHSVCIKSPCNTFQGILSHMKKPDSREVATRARMEDFFIVAFYIISFKKNQTWSALYPAQLTCFWDFMWSNWIFQPSTRICFKCFFCAWKYLKCMENHLSLFCWPFFSVKNPSIRVFSCGK